MKKVLFVVAALFVVVGLAAPSAEAQVACLKWVSFCDGIQVDSIVGSNIAGTWYKWDCVNNMPNMKGKIAAGQVQDSCGGANGNGIMVCRAGDGCLVAGSDWGFVLDTLDGTLDMFNGTYPGTCWIDQLAYTKTNGACTGLTALDTLGGSNVSSVQ